MKISSKGKPASDKLTLNASELLDLYQSAAAASILLAAPSRPQMIDQPAKAPTAGLAPTTPDGPTRRRIFLYLGMLIVLLSFGSPSGGLMDIPISFFLKNKLHLEAHEVATFRLVAAFPLYLSFLFGFIRDTWNPFGMRDRGYMLLFGALTATTCVVFAFIPFSYASLLAAIVLVTTLYLFVASAQNGLTSIIG